MYLVYVIALLILFMIFFLLRKEENRLNKDIIQGIVNKYWVLRERRRYVRFDEEIKVRYNLVNKPSNPTYSKTTNISRKGICLMTYEKLKEKTYLELNLEIPGSLKPVKVIGQVVWVKELLSSDKEGRRIFYVGIKFAKIRLESEATLLKYLEALKPQSIQ